MFAKYAKVIRNSNYITTVKDGTASVRLPGPSGDDLTRYGNIGIWRIVRWCELPQITAEHANDPVTGRVFLDIDVVHANRMMFTVSMKCTVGEDLYKLVDASEPTPFSINFSLCNIGNTSLGYVFSVVDESGRELAQLVKQVVVVDDNSRKPMPIPDWWKQKNSSFVGEKRKLVLPALSVPAENTYKHAIKVSWNDIDAYYHVNYLTYLMFCFDAAMDAIRNGFYIGFFDDIFKYNVKTLEVRYVNEAVAGDIVTVVTWQDAENSRIIHFSIEREGTIVIQCSMEFFQRANL